MKKNVSVSHHILMYFVHLLCIRNYDRCTRKMLEYSLPIEQQLIFHVMWFIVWPWSVSFEISILDQLTGTYILSHIVPWSALISQVSSLFCGNDVSTHHIIWNSVLDYATMIAQILCLFIDIVITSLWMLVCINGLLKFLFSNGR